MNYESLNRNLNEIFELLAKSNPSEMLQKIKARQGKFAILTADNPRFHTNKGPVPGTEKNPDGGTKQPWSPQEMHNELSKLRQEGKIGDFFHVQGKYDFDPTVEHSFLVQEPKNFGDIHELGKRAGQESVFTSRNGTHQVAYVNGEHAGKAFQGEGHQEYNTDPHTDPSIPEANKPGAYSGMPTKGHKKFVFMNTNYNPDKPPEMPIMQKSSGDGDVFNPKIDYSRMVPITKDSSLSRLRESLKRRNAYGTSTSNSATGLGTN
jgi:hypothetical protein